MSKRAGYIARFVSLFVFVWGAAVSARADAPDSLVVRHLEDVPVFDSSAPKKFMEFRPHVAVGISSVVNNYGNVISQLSDLQFAAGAMMRAGLNVNFAIHRSMLIGTGLELGFYNSRCALSIVDYQSNSISSVFIKNHYYDVNIPIYLSLRFHTSRRIYTSVDLGMYLSQGLSGKVRSSGYTSGENALGQSIINHLYYEKDYFDDDVSIVNSVKRTDYGPRVAVGLVYRNRISFDWVFQVSAKNLALNHNVLDVKYRHINLGFQFGLVF